MRRRPGIFSCEQLLYHQPADVHAPEVAEVASVQKNGGAGTKNGELLARAEQAFDIFVTMDGNMQFQQNYARLRLAIVAPCAPSNRLRR